MEYAHGDGSSFRKASKNTASDPYSSGQLVIAVLVALDRLLLPFSIHRKVFA